MTSKPVNSLRAFTNGEILAMCKLVQMVANSHQFKVIDMETWQKYVEDSFGMGQDAAAHLVNLSRRVANKVLHEAD